MKSLDVHENNTGYTIKIYSIINDLLAEGVELSLSSNGRSSSASDRLGIVSMAKALLSTGVLNDNFRHEVKKISHIQHPSKLNPFL